MVAAAPKAIEADARVFLDAMERVETDPSVQDNEKVQQAVENVNRYAAQGCEFYARRSGGDLAGQRAGRLSSWRRRRPSQRKKPPPTKSLITTIHSVTSRASLLSFVMMSPGWSRVVADLDRLADRRAAGARLQRLVGADDPTVLGRELEPASSRLGLHHGGGRRRRPNHAATGREAGAPRRAAAHDHREHQERDPAPDRPLRRLARPQQPVHGLRRRHDERRRPSPRARSYWRRAAVLPSTRYAAVDALEPLGRGPSRPDGRPGAAPSPAAGTQQRSSACDASGWTPQHRVEVGRARPGRSRLHSRAGRAIGGAEGGAAAANGASGRSAVRPKTCSAARRGRWPCRRRRPC